MYAFVFIFAAIGLAAYARKNDTPLETVCWWGGGLLVAFVILRIALHKFGEFRLNRRFEELYSTYNAQFGSTSSGRQFLDQVQPWHQRLNSSLGLLSLFGDWHVVLASRLAVALAEHFSGKTPEQRTLENQINSVAQTVATRRKQFSESIILTPLVIIAIGGATQTPLLPSPVGRLTASTPAPTTTQYLTTDEAQKVAIQRYPALGVAGSKLNTEFVARYKQYQQTRPDYFRDTSWPIRLAEELSQTSHPK